MFGDIINKNNYDAFNYYHILHLSFCGFIPEPFSHFHTSLNSSELVNPAITRMLFGLCSSNMLFDNDSRVVASHQF